jgi:hypothetical protein
MANVQRAIRVGQCGSYEVSFWFAHEGVLRGTCKTTVRGMLHVSLERADLERKIVSRWYSRLLLF